MSILVIGNGFDIAHGLRTSYSDFIKMVQKAKEVHDATDLLTNDEMIPKLVFKANEFKKISDKNIFLNHFLRSNEIEDSWCGVEREIEKVIDVWIDILDNVTAKGRIGNMNSETKFVMYSFSDFIEIEEAFLIEKKEFRSEVHTKLAGIYVTERGVNKYSIINKLKIELNDLIKAFELYLQLFVETVTPDQCIDLSVIKPELVINFNYTETNKVYGIDQSKVKYVHGKIGIEPNNIVMGMNVYGNDYNRDFVYFMKFFQRIQHKNDIVKVRDLYEVADTNKIYGEYNQKPKCLQNVYFIGHSMSNADGDVIRLLKRPVMETETFEIVSEFTIYYYDQKDYEQKVINLFEVFGKDETIQMIHDEEIVFEPLSNIILEV